MARQPSPYGSCRDPPRRRAAGTAGGDRPRRLVSAETGMPRLVWSVRASEAQLQRVRHQPDPYGAALSNARGDRCRVGVKTGVRTGGTSWPWSSCSKPRLPSR